MTKRLIAHKDNASGQLTGSISGVTTTIPLGSGEGASFPTTYRGAATSGGSSTALNATGIGAEGFAVGDIIENVTDGSYAVVLTINTNDIVTTPLVGGTGNTWDNADVWAINRFVVTAINYDTDGITILKREKIFIGSRTSDNLYVESVPSTGRGYDGSSALSFSADDYIYLFSVSAAFDGIGIVFSDIIQTVQTLSDSIASKVTNTGAELYAESTTGTDAYAITLSPAITALTAGLEINFLADVANTGAATLDPDGLGATPIVKSDGVTVLDDDDIKAGSIAKVIYDGTSFQLQTPPAATLSTAIATEVTTVFNATDITGAELETLSAGATSNADAEHTHNPAAQDAALFAGGVIHLPVYLDIDSLIISQSYFGASRLWKRPGSISMKLDNTNSKGAFRTDGVDTMAGAGGEDGLFEDGSATPLNMSKTFTSVFKFRFGVAPASTDTFFIGFASTADSLDATYASPTTETHIGYQWNGTNWRITNADATTQKTTNVAVPSTGWHEMKIVCIAGTSIEFILDGSSLGVHTTNLPGSGALIFYVALASVSGTTRYVEVSRFIDMYIPTT